MLSRASRLPALSDPPPGTWDPHSCDGPRRAGEGHTAGGPRAELCKQASAATHYDGVGDTKTRGTEAHPAGTPWGRRSRTPEAAGGGWREDRAAGARAPPPLVPLTQLCCRPPAPSEELTPSGDGASGSSPSRNAHTSTSMPAHRRMHTSAEARARITDPAHTRTCTPHTRS